MDRRQENGHFKRIKVETRSTIDYRKLNEKTINDKYPLPNINDILDNLGSSIHGDCEKHMRKKMGNSSQ